MVKVEFLGPINQEPLEVEAKTLADVAKVLQEIEAVGSWLNKCAVAVNDEMTNDLNRALNAGDRVSILPPVCGG
jgi:molybdopterin synthase sulfur carrier subunit